MTVPAVSVILPAFNRLRYLRSAVDSVFAQSFGDWEMIIADDGSDEETNAFLAELESRPKVTVIRLPHSGNPGTVRNAGARQARGRYIAFLDSDDTWLPQKLERQIDLLRHRKDRRWIYTGYLRIDDLGNALTVPSPVAWIPCRGAILEPLLRLEASVATAAVVVERELFMQVGGFDETLSMFEHYDLWLRLAQHSEIDLIDEPLTCLRSHESHYSAMGLPLLEGRRALLTKMRRHLTDPRLRRIVEQLYARNALNIASFHADTDRSTAMRAILDGLPGFFTNKDWWTGLPRVLLKVAVPRRALAVYRRSRG